MTLTTDQRERLKQLHSALINDITDEMGIDDNIVPCTRIQSVWSRDPVVGTAHTSQRVEIGYEEGGSDDPQDSQFFQYLDETDDGDFIVMAAPKDTNVGLWGELLSTVVQENGAAGALIDGPTRDSRLIEQHGFPVWAEGHSSIESFGRVSFREYDVPVTIDGVTINPGDVVFADYESIAIIDSDIVDEIIERGEKELRIEDRVRADIRSGDSIFEVWEKHETL